MVWVKEKVEKVRAGGKEHVFRYFLDVTEGHYQ